MSVMLVMLSVAVSGSGPNAIDDTKASVVAAADVLTPTSAHPLVAGGRDDGGLDDEAEDAEQRRHGDRDRGGGGGGVFAIVGGAFSIIGGITALVLGIIAAENREDLDISIPFGSAATVAVGITVPIAGIGAGVSDGDGVVPLMIISWVTYGITLVLAITEIALGLSEVSIPYEVILSTAMSAMLAGTLMGIHALVDGGQALSDGYAQGPTLSPSIGLARVGNDDWLPTLGARLVF